MPKKWLRCWQGPPLPRVLAIVFMGHVSRRSFMASLYQIEMVGHCDIAPLIVGGGLIYRQGTPPNLIRYYFPNPLPALSVISKFHPHVVALFVSTLFACMRAKSVYFFLRSDILFICALRANRFLYTVACWVKMLATEGAPSQQDIAMASKV